MIIKGNGENEGTMAFKKLTAPSLTDLFVEEIKTMILTGQLAIGEKLPPERKLAEEMNVSLAVINAGISRLTALGFIRVAPRKGIFVADYIREGNIDTMMQILEFSGHYINHDVLDPISTLRRSIETGSSRLACVNRTREQLETMASLIDQISDKDCIGQIPELAFRFHHEVAIASGNPYYPMIIMSFRSVYQIFFRIALTNPSEQDRIASQLRTLYEAIKAGDVDAAEHAVNSEIDAWLQRFEHSGKISK